MFEELLVAAALQLDEYGKHRIIYGLRHTPFELRLLKGDNVDNFDMLMLARNGGTSPQMLERSYLTGALPAMKAENLHSLKPVDLSRFAQPEQEKPRVSIQIRVSLAEPENEPIGA